MRSAQLQVRDQEEVRMAFILFVESRLAALLVPAFLAAGAVLAQAQDQAPERQSLRQLTPQSAQQREDVATVAERNRAEADRKGREMDRRLNQVRRSICVGC
jgi:hypothetical protein